MIVLEHDEILEQVSSLDDNNKQQVQRQGFQKQIEE